MNRSTGTLALIFAVIALADVGHFVLRIIA